ncbi:conserved hypothetical protein [Theileria orientalis strain Shintoku]|uniref:EF-hand domain-containing protein n=1 Tax=Theileria orientalis strain Shintoku TaxID=869250 RepID=J4DNT0_THEOR|nr:conserved hypothetical protein [Theileria orientalis strain Shintoku]PVC53975.1 hypothetical protein MACL_00003385 [Theileria orientalis]BAM39494.1 conserved hypothetical protein [Theileria orientalis strain Shintoku]|eukprot:XP_009689795.1 conserved hypothetical protein [Theileria orientalis strain Shintoku]
MDNNLNRLECKLKEIILDSRETHTSDYSRSIREDHLFGSAFGKNAYTLDDVANGTTIFMPWKLHRPLEDVFNRLSEQSFMSHTSFENLVDNFGLFPNFQNSRKKEDILNYILQKANPNSGQLDFEQFLLALFLLSKYRASVQHINEQYAFNAVLNTVVANAQALANEDAETNFDLNLDKNPSFKKFGSSSRTSSKNLDGVIYNDDGLIVDTNNGKVYDSPRKLETKDFSETLEGIKQEETKEFLRKLSSAGKMPSRSMGGTSDLSRKTSGLQPGQSSSFDPELVRRLLDVLREQNLLNDSKALQDSLEREINLRNDMESSYMVKLSRLESEKSSLNDELAAQKLELGKAQVELESVNRQYEDYKTSAEQRISDLKSEREQMSQKLSEANEQLERQAHLKARAQKNQQMLLLETEVEVKLFSMFCVYKDEECVDGEFVLGEEQLILFCVDFGLTETEPPSGPDDAPKAKQAYNKVCEYGYDGKLNYALFKEFLMNLAMLMKPEFSPREAFRYVVFQLVFYSCNNLYGEKAVKDYHPVYVTEDNNPWGPDAENYYPPQQQQQPQRTTDPNKFVDVEGKVWFSKEEQNANPQGDNAVSTPRFD